MSSKGKKKKSFYQKAKNFGKSGRFGQGNQLSEEEFHFFMQVLKHLRDPEFQEKDLILKNFLRSFDSDEKIKHLITNQIVSRILDDVLPTTPQDKVVFFINSISENFRIYCTDPYASHVIQTLLCLSYRYYQKSAVVANNSQSKESNEQISKENRKHFKLFLIKVSKYVYNNLEEFVTDTYASHIIRSVMEVCSGVEVAANLKSSQKAQTNHSIRNDSKIALKVPKELRLLCNELFIRLTQIPDFHNIIMNDCTSAVFQTALYIVSITGDEEMSSRLINHICQNGFESLGSHCDQNCHPLFTSNATSRLFEAVMTSASSSEQQNIFSTYCRGQMEILVQHNLANFAVQKILTSWKDQESFDQLLDCVCVHLEKSLKAGNTGILYSVVQACRKFSSKQSQCLQNIGELFECCGTEEQQLKLVPCLLHLLSLPIYKEKRENNREISVSLHGALIIQELLNFKKPIKVIRSLCAMPLGDLQMMACDPRGSHIFNAFNTASFVGEKSRETLVHKMKGSFVTLACSKHGSRSLEAIWDAANMKSKTTICSELSHNSNRLEGDVFGKFIYNNFKIKFFKRNDQSDWQEIQQRQWKKRELLKGFLTEKEEEEPPKKKKKRKKEKDFENFVIDTGGEVD